MGTWRHAAAVNAENGAQLLASSVGNTVAAGLVAAGPDSIHHLSSRNVTKVSYQIGLQQ